MGYFLLFVGTFATMASGALIALCVVMMQPDIGLLCLAGAFAIGGVMLSAIGSRWIDSSAQGSPLRGATRVVRPPCVEIP